MVTTPTHTRPEFIDTYWIIPEYSTTPYGDFTDNNPDFIKKTLPVLANFAYSNHALVNPSDRFRSLNDCMATIDAEDSVFFYVADNAHLNSMVALLGQSSDWLETIQSSTANLDSVTAHYEFRSSSGDFLNNCMEIASMATIPSHTQSKFTDTYWIIPLDSAVPYGKVSFTHKDLLTTTNSAYTQTQHLSKTGAGFDSLNSKADISRYKRFFYVRDNQRYAPIMVGCSGGAERLAGFFATGLSTLLRLATLFDSRVRGLKKPSKEAKMMAITKPLSKFIDTYWIISKDSNKPSSKVSFTRNDCRIFNALFKDSRLIWAGRQPVHAGMGGN